VLVATDVAARGLDVKGISLVVQLEPPKDTESYIHRSGRTARAGQSGTCVTFFNSKNVEFLERVEEHAGITMERIGIPSDDDVERALAEAAEREKLNPKEVFKSLLTGEEHKQTIQMTKTDEGKLESLDKAAGHGLLKKYWAPKIVESV
jgi:superfamily II DNA/RNA helicase